MSKSFTAHTFTSDKEMKDWLYDIKNLEALKVKYPPSKYTGELNLVDKKIIITKKK